MRDFRDAKGMAQTLRETLGKKQVKLSHSESLELVAKMLGAADWNTLSAVLNASPTTSVAKASTHKLPAFPLRNVVPFPGLEFPLFVGRPHTVQALEAANKHRRELVLVAQRVENVDEPGLDDIYEIGATALILDIGPAVPGTQHDGRVLKLGTDPEGRPARGTRVVVQTQRRVAVRSFVRGDDGYEAEVEEIEDSPLTEAPDLVASAAASAEQYIASRDLASRGLPPALAAVRTLHDPGFVADVIAPILQIPLADKQSLLATLGPVARLESVVRHLQAAASGGG